MVYKVVSTKLTEEEHTKLLDMCNKEGCTPSAMIKDSLMKRITVQDKPSGIESTELGTDSEEKPRELSDEELRKLCGIKKK